MSRRHASEQTPLLLQGTAYSGSSSGDELAYDDSGHAVKKLSLSRHPDDHDDYRNDDDDHDDDDIAVPCLCDLTRYQWLVLFASWMGWGLDVFDGLLFNFVAPNCIPTLLGLPLGSPEAKSATLNWTGILSSVLLICWAIGGIAFGKVADLIGRKRTMQITIFVFAIGTGLCAISLNIWMLLAFRIIASLGIGGEWASGVLLVAETMPEHRRVAAGVTLYTSAPVGLLLATLVNYVVAGVLLPDRPDISWRIVFAFGLLPAFVAIGVRLLLSEPERWEQAGKVESSITDLFSRQHIRATYSGLMPATVTTITWWSVSSFIPIIATGLAISRADSQGLDQHHRLELIEQFKLLATGCFNAGGLLGTILTYPVAETLGRKLLYAIYFAAGSALLIGTFMFLTDYGPFIVLIMYFPIGVAVFGIFSSYTFYLSELFPMHLRGTGAGVCYNAGRLIAAIGPFVVGSVASRESDAYSAAATAMIYVGILPIIGVVGSIFQIETKHESLML